MTLRLFNAGIRRILFVDKLWIWMQKTWINEMAGNFLMKLILGTFGSFWRQSGRIRHRGASSGQWRRSYPPHHNHSQSRSVPINIHEKWKCPLKESESDYKSKFSALLWLEDGAVQRVCTCFMTPGPENGRNFFWWIIGVQNHQGTHQNWFLPFWGASGGHFSKNPKFDIFQILNFPEVLFQLPLDLESWNFLW